MINDRRKQGRVIPILPAGVLRSHVENKKASSARDLDPIALERATILFPLYQWFRDALGSARYFDGGIRFHFHVLRSEEQSRHRRYQVDDSQVRKKMDHMIEAFEITLVSARIGFLNREDTQQGAVVLERDSVAKGDRSAISKPANIGSRITQRSTEEGHVATGAHVLRFRSLGEYQPRCRRNHRSDFSGFDRAHVAAGYALVHPVVLLGRAEDYQGAVLSNRVLVAVLVDHVFFIFVIIIRLPRISPVLHPLDLWRRITRYSTRQRHRVTKSHYGVFRAFYDARFCCEKNLLL